MGKNIFSLFVLLLSLSAWGIDTNPFVFIEAQSHSLSDKNHIQLTYSGPCNVKFVQVIRHESVDAKTQIVTIALGVLGQANTLSSCAGAQQRTVDAGPAYSGREYNVQLIPFKAPRYSDHTKVGFPVVPGMNPRVYGSKSGVSCPVEVIPGKSIGPMELGKSIADLGVEVKQVKDSDAYIAGPFEAHVDQNKKLTKFSALLGNLPYCVQYKGKEINPAASMKTLIRTFANCKLDGHIGATVYHCEGISLEHSTAKGSTVELIISRSVSALER